MEEKKTKSKKETIKKEDNKVKKLSYEELENAARQLSVQLDALIKENNKLRAAANQLQLNNLYTELNFRFKVIELQDSFDPEFVDNCVREIERIMTASKDDDEGNTEDNTEDNTEGEENEEKDE